MKKTTILYGSLKTGIQKKALELLTEWILDDTLDQPECYCWNDTFPTENRRLIVIGTRKNNPLIAEALEPTLTTGESYRISVRNEQAFIEGFDDSGILYGCVDFLNHYLTHLEYPNNDYYHINSFEIPWPDFDLSSAPAITQRGLWTWGHVIYDYRGYLDHMAKLKLNTLTIWNDRAPVNASDIVKYAHSCGIKVIWGYSWLWSTHCADVDWDHLCDYSQQIFDQFEREYSTLGGDGIYFQSATELNAEEVNGHIIAEEITKFVNHTAALFFAKYPDLELQFGLHATSVKDKLSFIQQTDPRIRIVWEDQGAFPFAYLPTELSDFEQTKALVQKTASLRGPNDRFGVVTKGFTKLDWYAFQHPDAPRVIGVGSKEWAANRMQRKKKIWRYLQAYWLSNADKAQEMVQHLKKCKPHELLVSALLEDGMFEEEILYPAALFAEMLWNPYEDLKKLMSSVALRRYVSFA